MVGALIGLASARGATVPLGSEFQVNSYTSGLQAFSGVANDADGDFVVIWHSNLQDNELRGIFAQRFASSGAAAGVEFKVNTYTRFDQAFPVVAMDSDGDFVVVWESYRSNDNTEIIAQRYSSAGSRLGGEFVVNQEDYDYQGYSAVAMNASGAFVVSWSS